MQTQNATVIALPAQRGRTAPQGTPGAVRPRVRLEVTRRGRALITLLAFVLGLLVAAAALLVLDVPSALAGGEETTDHSVTVVAGETLWDYADRYAPEGVSAQEYVVQVRALNHLPTGRIVEGQELELPAVDAQAL